MEKLKLLKEKKEAERKDSTSFYLPIRLTEKVKQTAAKYNLSQSEFIEVALIDFFERLSNENDLESSVVSQQEAYQTGVIVP
ncbi:MAG: hypothetical protein H9535_19875 [Ignavibacteria bacterium]|nr:hypothetical protein [Ignavibacteria bacterium]